MVIFLLWKTKIKKIGRKKKLKGMKEREREKKRGGFYLVNLTAPAVCDGGVLYIWTWQTSFFFFFFFDVAACRPRKQMAAGHYLPFFLLVFLLFTRLFLCENEKNPERGSRVETRKFRNQNIKIALPLMSNRFSEIETLFLLLFWRNRWSRSDDSAANGFFFFSFFVRMKEKKWRLRYSASM